MIQKGMGSSLIERRKCLKTEWQTSALVATRSAYEFSLELSCHTGHAHSLDAAGLLLRRTDEGGGSVRTGVTGVGSCLWIVVILTAESVKRRGKQPRAHALSS